MTVFITGTRVMFAIDQLPIKVFIALQQPCHPKLSPVLGKIKWKDV
jgi:hypothetical protein